VIPKLNGSWANLPAIMGIAFVPMLIIINIAPQTEMGWQFTKFGLVWSVAWGVLAGIGHYFDRRAARRSEAPKVRGWRGCIPEAWLRMR
jgi:hypothetical protein